jgi:L-lactate dehydrogenase complex protein LldG
MPDFDLDTVTAESMQTRQSTIPARQTILSSIREHLAASERFDAQHSHASGAEQASPAKPAQDDRRPAIIELFHDALEAVSGVCLIVQTVDEAATAVQKIIDQEKPQRLAVSDATVVTKIVAQLKTDASLLDAPSQSELFDCDLGITAAQWGIAETGTLVLESERERNRLASLVPPVHVAIIQAGQIRRTMSEVLNLIKNSEVGLSRAITLITGPSRTSDIELTLAIGVHGPGKLYVIVIDDVQQTV